MKNKLIFLLFVLGLITTLVSQSRWKEIQLPYSTHKFTIIDFADSLTGWIFSEDGVYLRTSNGGASWALDSTSNVTKVGEVKCFGFSSGYIITEPIKLQGRPISIYRTTDSKSWEKILFPDTLLNQIYTVGFLTDRTLMVPYFQGILQSVDNGNSWTINGTFASGHLQSIAFSDSLNGFLEMGGQGTELEYVVDGFRTYDGGKNWVKLKENDCSMRTQIIFYNNLYGFQLTHCRGTVGNWYGLGVTNDGGISWQGVEHDERLDIITAIRYKSDKEFILFSTSSLLKDSDSTFYVVSKDTLNLRVIAFESINERYNWILATGNRLFQSIDIPTTGIEKEKSSSPNQFNLNQNYPNPFNPETRIRYEIPKRSFVSLELYDLLGRKIVTLVDQEEDSGEHTIALQSGTYKLTSGIYFYTLRADRFIQTRKMILLK